MRYSNKIYDAWQWDGKSALPEKLPKWLRQADCIKFSDESDHYPSLRIKTDRCISLILPGSWVVRHIRDKRLEVWCDESFQKEFHAIVGSGSVF